VSTTAHDPKTISRRAIEEVCARGDFEKAGQFYSPHFRDHVNDLEYSGLEGVRESVSLYRSIFPDLEITVEDQVVEGDRVASHWKATGTNRGRHVTIRGITISHVVDGKIVEDWGYSDTAGLLRQLGPIRAAALGAEQLLARLRRR
jgi:predicted ester cyclase